MGSQSILTMFIIVLDARNGHLTSVYVFTVVKGAILLLSSCVCLSPKWFLPFMFLDKNCILYLSFSSTSAN
jgi:hypothetical protein